MNITLPVNIHPDCFKINDSRVQLLRTGKLSVEAFAFTIKPTDPFVVFNDTIYALSEQEFYIRRGLVPVTSLIESTFKAVMALEDLSFMSPEDRNFVLFVKKDLPSCPICRYKRHKTEIYSVGKKYGIDEKQTVPIGSQDAVYPGTPDIESTVSILLKDFYKLPMPERQACLDCVEKHIAQAYILANEVLMGYPEHMTLMCGHLCEAIEESPAGAEIIRDTLRFCLAKSLANKTPFLPINALLGGIWLARRDADAEITAMSREEAPMTLELNFTPQMQDELANLTPDMKAELCTRLQTVDDAVQDYAKHPEDEVRLAFEGGLATAAEAVATLAPSFANMLRNRRLMFRASPDLMAESGFSMEPVIIHLKQK